MGIERGKVPVFRVKTTEWAKLRPERKAPWWKREYKENSSGS
jgi:hypothetical protein